MLFPEFLKICAALNAIGIRPLLYGSLGLERITGRRLDPKDIDMLIPQAYLAEQWDLLRQTVGKLGYALADLHEHEFTRGGFRIAFASIEELETFAGIRMNRITAQAEGACTFLLLDLEQYRRVYTRSAQDGYRRGKNHGKDDAKIALIDGLLALKPTSDSQG